MKAVNPSDLSQADNVRFLPTTQKELKRRGWERPDIILVNGDSYMASPYMGVAVIGKVLLKRVSAQPLLPSRI